jgi:hypothetical protein
MLRDSWVLGTHSLCPWAPVSHGSPERSELHRDFERKGSRRIQLTVEKPKRHRISTVASAWETDNKEVPVYGVYNSALSSSLTASLPPALTTLPLWSTVEVWPARALLMLPVALHAPLAGL